VAKEGQKYLLHHVFGILPGEVEAGRVAGEAAAHQLEMVK